MALHPVLLEKLNDALTAEPAARSTRRDAQLPKIAGKVHAVIGMRRAGKTTFLRQLQATRRETAPPYRALYFSFDDDRLAQIDAGQLSLLLEEYYRRHPELRGRETTYWYLDEIQLVPGWERFMRRVMDSERIEIVVSGSSARMLSREVHTSLRGRAIATVIRPFSLREFLRHRGEEPDVPAGQWTAAQRSLIERRFREFLEVGGFPEAQGLTPAVRVELLQGYVDTVLFRDVVERYAVQQVAALRWLVRQCLRNPTGSFSGHRFWRDLRSQGLGVAKDAVHAMLAHIQDAFLISAIPIATDSERQRNSNPRKIFPVDPGLIGAFDASGRPNLGHALETAVLNELESRKVEVGYVRTDDGLEVDFRVRLRGQPPKLIQVCADPSDAVTLTRELRALRSAAQAEPRARQLLLVMNADVASGIDGGHVEIRSACEWMLEPPDAEEFAGLKQSGL